MKFLFVCVHNAGRSQMAEAFFNNIIKRRNLENISCMSAGTAPTKNINPVAVDAMKEIGIDISKSSPKILTYDMIDSETKIITMGCNVDPEKINKLTDENVKDWELPNPAGLEISEVRKIRDDIKKRVGKLIKKAIDKAHLYEESIDDFALKYAKLKNSPRRLSNDQIAESMYMSTRTLQRRLKDAKLKGRKIGKSTAFRKTMSEAKWGKVVDLIDSCDI